MKILPPKSYPAPWHLEGPYDLDGHRWGSNMAIVASNGECVLSEWAGDSDWPEMAQYLVRLVNRNAGFPDAPLRAAPRPKIGETSKK